MKQYFGYIRVSTPKQGRGVSLDEQRSAISAYAERNSLKIAEWFVETETAAKQGRTEYTKMIRGLESGKAVGVIIHKIDRGARNMKDWANLGELIDAGVDVQFVHESLDLRSRGGRLAADIQAVVAADYIRNLRDEVLKGFYGRLKQGMYPLPAPIGYLDRGAGIAKEIDPIAGPLVRHAFERYSAGNIGLIALQREMARFGLKTRFGKPLAINGLAGMLHNQFYTGIIRIERRGESFQGVHTPLVTRELFDRVQYVMAGRHVPKVKTHAFLYRGLIGHIGCTRRLTGERVKDRFVYYRCHGRHCGGAAVPERTLNKVIDDKILPVVCTPQDMRDLRDLVEDDRAQRSEGAASDKAALQLQIHACNSRLTRLTDALLDGDISKEEFEERKERSLTERSGLQDRLDALNGEPEWLHQFREFELKNTQLLRYKTLTDDEKRDLVSALCSNFGVDGKNLVITLRFPYQEIAETLTLHSGGPLRGDVRTRAWEILQVLRSHTANDDTSDVKRLA